LSLVTGGVGTALGAAIGGQAGAVLGGTAATVSKFGSVLAESIDRLRHWGDALVQANLKWADFSGAMSAVKAEQRSFDIHRSQRMGGSLAPTARQFVEARETFVREFQ